MEATQLNQDNKAIYVNEQTKRSLQGIVQLIERQNSSLKFTNLLKSANILLSLVYSPASVADYSELLPSKCKIISLDLSLCRILHDYSDAEIAALILHECGHYFNLPREADRIEVQEKLDSLAKAKVRFMMNGNVAEVNTLSLQEESYKQLKNNIPEFYADEYVAQFSLTPHLITALEKFLATSTYSTPQQIAQVESRLEKLKTMNH
jgi:hypothetical protein